MPAHARVHRRPRNLHKHTVITHLFVQQFVHLLKPSLDHNILTHSFDICSWSRPLVLSSGPPMSATAPQSHAPACSHPLTISTSHPLFPVTHFLSLSLPLSLSLSHTPHPVRPSHPLTPWTTPVPHLTSLFIPHNSLWLRLLSPYLYRLPPLIPIKDLRAPLSANQVVIRAAKIRGLINKGLSLLASDSLCLNR